LVVNNLYNYTTITLSIGVALFHYIIPAQSLHLVKTGAGIHKKSDVFQRHYINSQKDINTASVIHVYKLYKKIRSDCFWK